MKKHLIFLLLTIFAIGANSSPIGKQKALQFAKNFYYTNTTLDIGKESLSSEFVTEKRYKNTLCFYFIKFTNAGYVILSADDAFFPVIGFSDENNSALDAMPPELEWWLQMRANEMISSGKFNSVADESTSKVWNSLENVNTSKKTTKNTEVLPLLTSKWDQGDNYNYNCPEASSGPGGKCYAGCVATAMSQIMYYYKYPEHGYSSHSYYHPYYVSISADFGSTTYDWASMTNSINASSKDAISTLIYQCGVSVDMNYGTNGSSAQSESVKYALSNYFNYSGRSEYKEKELYLDPDWNQMLMDNLDNGQPVYYSGSGSSGGHAFVCDGYKDSCFFHFNWGWSGAFNGYFYTSSLNSGNGDFTGYQSALFNIAPYDYPYCQNQKTYTKNAYSFSDGSGYSLYWKNSDCDWLIKPDNGNKVTVQFTSFYTETDKDIVTIYDGENDLAPVLAQYSGYGIPAAVTSTGGSMYVTFKTDSVNQAQGWQLIYSTLASDIPEVEQNSSFSIFPNPAENTLFVNLTSPLQNQAELNIINVLGENVFFEKLAKGESNKTIDLSSISKGIYFVVLKTKDTKSINKLIIFK